MPISVEKVEREYATLVTANAFDALAVSHHS